MPRGVPLSEEHKRKISEALKGRKRGGRGRPPPVRGGLPPRSAAPGRDPEAQKKLEAAVKAGERARRDKSVGPGASHAGAHDKKKLTRAQRYGAVQKTAEYLARGKARREFMLNERGRPAYPKKNDIYDNPFAKAPSKVVSLGSLSAKESASLARRAKKENSSPIGGLRVFRTRDGQKQVEYNVFPATKSGKPVGFGQFTSGHQIGVGKSARAAINDARKYLYLGALSKPAKGKGAKRRKR